MSTDALYDDDLTPEALSAAFRVRVRNYVLMGMLAFAVLWFGVFIVLFGLSFGAHDLGDSPMFRWFGLVMIGQFAWVLDLMALGLYSSVHVLFNQRLELPMKIFWLLAMYFTGVAALVYLIAEVFTEPRVSL